MGTENHPLRTRSAGGTFHLIPYCHPDFAWTHHREWHAERYAVTLCDALDLAAKHAEFRFCVEPWIDQIEAFLERCPDRVEELRQRLNDGAIGVLAFTLTSPRPATCADETFLRNMILGRRRYRQFAPNAPLRTMACPDVGIGHSQLPQILRLAGAELYRGWRCDTAFSQLGVPREFWWKGLDGSEIVTSRGTYGGLVDGAEIPGDFSERWDDVVTALLNGALGRAMDQSDARVWWVPQGTDDTRPFRSMPDDEPVPFLQFIAEWNTRESSRFRLSTPEEFRLALLDQGLPLWEGVVDQVDVGYNSGWHGSRGLWRLRDELDRAAVTAERACAIARLAGCDDVAQPDALEALWVEVVRVASHALQWIFGRDWEWIIDGARMARRRLEEITDDAVTGLSGVGRASAEDGRPLVLFNPLPYPRSELIEVPWVQPRPGLGHAVADSAGADVPLQLGEAAGETWGGRVVESPLIFRASVPALGCAVYRVRDAAPPVTDLPGADDCVDTGALVARVSERGIESLTHTGTGLEWTGGTIASPVFSEMGPGILHVGPVLREVSVEAPEGRWVLSGPLRWVYRWEGAIDAHKVRQDVVLDQGAEHADIVTRIYCAGANGFFSLRFALPITGAVDVDIPFGVERRDVRREPYAPSLPEGWQNIERHRLNQFWARSWVSADGDRGGVTVFSIDGDRYWIHDPDTGRLDHILFTALGDEASDWGPWEGWITRSRLALGWHEFRHRVRLHAGNWRGAGVCAEADRLRHPLRPTKPVGAAVPAPRPGAPLEVEPRSVRLSAFHEAREGWVLRIYESAGEPTVASVLLPATFASASRVDLNLDAVRGPVGLAGERLEVPLEPWQVACVLLR
jgi:hypothetical protein